MGLTIAYSNEADPQAVCTTEHPCRHTRSYNNYNDKKEVRTVRTAAMDALRDAGITDYKIQSYKSYLAIHVATLADLKAFQTAFSSTTARAPGRDAGNPGLNGFS